MTGSTQTTQRLRHPTWLIIAFGGVIGAAINVVLTLGLHAWLIPSPFLAFFLGTLANQLFQFVYYKLIFVQVRDADVRPPWVRLLQYLIVAGVAVGLLWVAMDLLHLTLLPGMLLCIVILSALNLLMVRMASFGSAELAMIEYTEMPESFYDDQADTNKVNLIRAWFHRSRFDRLRQFVERYFKPGMKIADLGCGNCMWNTNGLPVTGVDINRGMMDWAKKQGRLADYVVRSDLSDTTLPDKSFDIVIMSETLEHLVNFDQVVREVRRILKDDGVFLITVPYDYFFGPFFFMFNINCLYQGFVRGSKYHRVRCGHVNHFNKRRLTEKLQANGWRVREINVVNMLSLYAAAEKGA